MKTNHDTAAMAPPRAERTLSPLQTVLSERVDRTSWWLRASGVVAVLAAASTFMLQRWNDGGSDDLRYLYLLAHGVMLFGAALFCGAKMKESRTARTFLLLTLGTLPACFAVLGGMVLSRFQWESNVPLPHFALWRAHSDITAVGWMVLTFGLAWGLTRLATRALARHSSSRISWTLMLSQALLLVPVRDPSLVGPLAMAGMLGAIGLELHWRTRPGMRTFEGRVIRALYWAAPAIVVGRCVFFYGFDALAFGCLVIALGAAVFFAARKTHEHSQGVGESAGAIIAAIGLGIVGIEIKQMIWPHSSLHVLSALPLALVLYGFSHVAERGRRFLVSAAAAVATLTAVGAVLVNGGLLSGVSAVTIGVCGVALGLLDDRRLVVVAGGVAAVVGLGCVVDAAIGFSSLMNWGSLTVLGIGSLLTAALVDRHRGRIVRRLERVERREAARRALAQQHDVAHTQYAAASVAVNGAVPVVSHTVATVIAPTPPGQSHGASVNQASATTAQPPVWTRPAVDGAA